MNSSLTYKLGPLWKRSRALAGRALGAAWSRLSGRARGQALIETALILHLLVILSIGVIEFGRAIHSYTLVARAAREGARVAIDCRPGEIETRARAAAAPLPAGSVQVIYTYPTATGETEVVVTVRHEFTAILPIVDSFWGGGTLTIQETYRAHKGGC
jgi:Flp pilus assembly protein TadG